MKTCVFDKSVCDRSVRKSAVVRVDILNEDKTVGIRNMQAPETAVVNRNDAAFPRCSDSPETVAEKIHTDNAYSGHSVTVHKV